jgi:hypothetical protein
MFLLLAERADSWEELIVYLRSRAFLQKLIVAQPIRKFRASFGTLKFTVIFARERKGQGPE